MELQIKTMGDHYTPIGIAKTKTPTTPNAGIDAEQQELSFIAGGNAKRCSHFGRHLGSFLQS